MSKAVMISVKPKWCELIANGKKTIEVRKSRPKIETPFKCYIYCTKGDYPIFNLRKITTESNPYHLTFYNQKVIGEFVCNDISKFTAEFTDGKTYEDIRYCYFDECEEEQEMIVVSNEWDNPNDSWICKESGLSFDEFKKYIGINFHDIPFYAWHISDLKIYDKPKELSQFKKINRDCWYADLGLAKRDWHECKNADCFFKRPPQSWCYVEMEAESNG